MDHKDVGFVLLGLAVFIAVIYQVYLTVLIDKIESKYKIMFDALMEIGKAAKKSGLTVSVTADKETEGKNE